MQRRLADSIENVMKLSDGLMIVDVIGGTPINFSMSLPALTAESALMRLNREVSHLTIRTVRVRNVSDLDIRWNLTLIL